MFSVSSYRRASAALTTAGALLHSNAAKPTMVIVRLVIVASPMRTAAARRQPRQMPARPASWPVVEQRRDQMQRSTRKCLSCLTQSAHRRGGTPASAAKRYSVSPALWQGADRTESDLRRSEERRLDDRVDGL